VALVPIEKAKDKHGHDTELTITGRYFLHTYFGDPLKHLNPKKKDGTERPWVQKLLQCGAQEVDGFDLANEKKTFFTHLGSDLKTATCKLSVTNFKIEPTEPAESDYYTLVLSRIEAAEFSFRGNTFAFTPDRKVLSSPAGSFEMLRNDVTLKLKPKKESFVALPGTGVEEDE
jgi:hypothetical protein